MISDVTERKRLEEKLREAAKIEALGRLTGGIAHDFNNMLAAILANVHFLIEDLGDGDPRHADALEIKEAGERAAALTRQLLAFSRRQVLEPKVVDLGSAVGGIEKMLRRLIGEDVELTMDCPPRSGSVRVDVSQIEQVIMNLAVNSRDAMPDGGKLIIETSSVDLDGVYAASHAPVTPGRYVMLAVTDTGVGMDAETRARVFEPFFTTKAAGKGTGLGLATCYGIVKQSGGFIWVYSEPGRGTTFKIYLPRVEDDGARESTRRATALTQLGTESILLVEDDERVRAAVRRMLEQRGYTVHVASDATHALELAASERTIDAVVSDIVMPGLNGPEVVSRVRELRPSVKSLLMSGYTDHAALMCGALEDGVHFIQKPLPPEALGKKMREVLDG